jgi:ubiquinone/menaquinone biosynthesis C-methylase UbiE
MKPGMIILDIGFGTGFPLIELSQRFDEKSKIYGVDIWEEAIIRTKNKLDILGIKNVKIFEESAENIPIALDQIDLITSNLGVNNFDNRKAVYKEVRRLLKPGGKVCITTNPVGTFKELLDLFSEVMSEMELIEEHEELHKYIVNRGTKDSIVDDFGKYDLHLVNSVKDSTYMRFTSALGLMNHSLMRIGFRAGWEEMISADKRKAFFNRLIARVDEIIELNGSFKMTIPMLYLEFELKK